MRSLEEAGKVVEPVPAIAVERRSLLGSGGLRDRLQDLHDRTSRRGRLLASMSMGINNMLDTREQSSEPFEPSEGELV